MSVKSRLRARLFGHRAVEMVTGLKTSNGRARARGNGIYARELFQIPSRFL